jgi:hypothetical protein
MQAPGVLKKTSRFSVGEQPRNGLPSCEGSITQGGRIPIAEHQFRVG